MVLEIAFGLGALIVGGALVAGSMQYKSRDPKNEKLTEDATKELYARTGR